MGFFYHEALEGAMTNEALGSVVNDDVNKGGRPTIYSEELADSICLRIANGKSLNRVCRDKDMPDKATVYRWIDTNQEFCDKYREATNQRAEFHFDEMLDIADAVDADTAEVAKAKVQIDTRKWILSRMNPTKYGDKQQIDNTSSDRSMTPMMVTPDEVIERMKQKQDEY